MMKATTFARSVGVAPGTTTLNLGATRAWMPYGTGIIELRGIDTSAVVRWDLIGVVGGIALGLSAAAAIIADKLGRR